MYYLLKVKGSGNLHDIIQLRDKDFTLIACFTLGKEEKAISSLNIPHLLSTVQHVLPTLEYFKIKQIHI